MLFDTHAHYDDGRFDADRFELLASMPENNVGLIVNPGCDMETSRIAVELAERFPFVYAAVGFHPHEAKSMTEEDLAQLESLAANPKVVALGEMGLDYHYDNSPREVQRLRFFQQMELARKLKMPVIIHEREATQDALDIVKQFKDLRGVYHCYSGSIETAREILAQGWYLSFTGVATYKNARRTTEVIEWMPLDRLMIETDSPYLAPVPVKNRRNSSLNVHYVAEKVAEIRGISVEEVEQATWENGRRFFDIRD